MTAATRRSAYAAATALLVLVVAVAAAGLVLRGRSHGGPPSPSLALRSRSTAAPRTTVPVVYAVTARASVDVRVSAAFPDAADRAQQWATFFAGLPHGGELDALRVDVVSEPELST